MESDGEDAFSQVPRCQTGKFLIQWWNFLSYA
jgi:hypothetical protein